MILTIKEISELAKFAGIEVNFDENGEEPSPDTEITIEYDKKLKQAYTTGNFAYYTEYPDEGCYMLGDEL